MSDKRFDRLDEKLDRLDMRLDNIDVTLTKQAAQLEYHIKRTDLLEEKVKPVVDYATAAWVAIKVAGAAAVIVGLLKALALL